MRSRERHGLVLVGGLAAGADRPDHLAVDRERDPARQRGGPVQGERAQPAGADLLFDLPARPDEDRCRARLVDRDLIARRLRALGPAELEHVAEGVNDGDHHAVAVLRRLLFCRRHHGVGALGI